MPSANLLCSAAPTVSKSLFLCLRGLRAGPWLIHLVSHVPSTASSSVKHEADDDDVCSWGDATLDLRTPTPFPSERDPAHAHRCLPGPPPRSPPPLSGRPWSERQAQCRGDAGLPFSAVVVTGLKLRFLIIPMRSYYLLIRSFWDQHQTDNNNKHSLHWNSVMTLLARGAVGRGVPWAWKRQAREGHFQEIWWRG